MKKPPRASGQQNHHYIPVFYLKGWTRADGRLCELSRPYRRVVPTRKHPGATGFKPDLYRIDGVPEEVCQVVETVFMKQTDDQASLILQLMLSGEAAQLPAERRSDWSRFILSLIHRNPEKVAWIQRTIVEQLPAAVQKYREIYPSIRKPGDPETFADFERHMAKSSNGTAVAGLLQMIIDSERVGTHLNAMKWAVVRLANHAREFLTSDRPIVRYNGLDQPDSHLMLPLSRHAVFIAGNNRESVQQLLDLSERKLVRYVNDTVAGQAKQYVYASSDWAQRFVDERLGLRPVQFVGNAPASVPAD
jgi:hypothetical protein